MLPLKNVSGVRAMPILACSPSVLSQTPTYREADCISSTEKQSRLQASLDSVGFLPIHQIGLAIYPALHRLA